MNFHLIFTLNRKVYEIYMTFDSFFVAEAWLESKGASYWEIGIKIC